MLSLGDALAVALMERKGFSPDQYRDFHPGGSFRASCPLLPAGALFVSSAWRRTLLAADDRGTIAWRGDTVTARAGTTASSRMT